VGSGPGPQENKDAKIPPGVQDVIVEDNFIQDNDTGIEVMPGTEGVLLRGNKFNRVVNPITPPDRLPRR
jgi:hypothetical protein